MTRKKELNNSSNRPWPKWAQPNGKLLLPISARLEIGSSGDVNGSKQLAKSDFLRTMANILFPLNVIFQHLVGHTHSLTHAHRFCRFLCIIWAWKILELSRAWDKSWFAWERRGLDALFRVSYFDVSKSEWGNRWTSPEKGPVLFIFRISHDFTQILVKWFHEQSEKTIQLLLHSGGAEEPFTLFKTRKLKDNRIWSEWLALRWASRTWFLCFFWCFGKDNYIKWWSWIQSLIRPCHFALGKCLGLEENMSAWQILWNWNPKVMQYGTISESACRKDSR